jgi:hypothetical protein
MDRNSANKRYGIHMSLPPGDPMRAAHLLGEDWEATRWYASEHERDLALEELRRKHPYYRIGDHPSLILRKLER